MADASDQRVTSGLKILFSQREFNKRQGSRWYGKPFIGCSRGQLSCYVYYKKAFLYIVFL